MAPPRTQKRKSVPQAYDSGDGFVANDGETSDQPNKRSKTSRSMSEKKSSHSASASQAQLDTDGNEYWEISKMRRVTISEFKGKRMLNIREYYEKDGKDLPGKKGISMTIEQYSALVDIMPQIEKTLEKKGETIPRPQYDAAPTVAPAGDQEEQDHDEGEAKEEEKKEVETKVRNGRKQKANIEATSDEDEDE